jgi:23S rRNA (cytosine1962-C5)-methyltransferase
MAASLGLRELVLPSSLTAHLAAGHPWVYRDHVPQSFRAPSGTWVRVRAGSWTGVALWDEESAIALRVFGRGTTPDDHSIERRVAQAWALRAPLRDEGVTGFRLVYGEGDGLPGLVVDYYDGHCVLVTYAKSVEVLEAPVVRALRKVVAPRSVIRRQGPGDVRVLLGQAPSRDLTITEHGGMRLHVDVFSGQKTGLFLDHRENRRFVAERARDKSVLNLFSYTGGFSVAAALGGARSVVSVDAAAPASAACEANFVLNGLRRFPHEAVTADVFEYLERASREQRRFDWVVCDPPSFAKNRSQLKAAEKAYRRLTALGFSVTAPGGLYAAASCTSQVGPESFRQALADACRKARVRFQIIHDVGQPLDHPVLAAHPEGRYLKFVVGRVLPQE